MPIRDSYPYIEEKHFHFRQKSARLLNGTNVDKVAPLVQNFIVSFILGNLKP